MPEPTGKSDFIAAARRAARAAAAEAPARADARTTGQPASGFRVSTLASLVRRHARSLIVGLSAVAIVLGSLHLATRWSGCEPEDQGARPGQPFVVARRRTHSAPAAASETLAAPEPTIPPGRQSTLVSPQADRAVAAPVPSDLTHPDRAPSNGWGASQAGYGDGHPCSSPGPLTSRRPRPRRFLTSCGLQSAAPRARPATTKGDPAAQVESAQRHAEGRGLTQNLRRGRRMV